MTNIEKKKKAKLDFYELLPLMRKEITTQALNLTATPTLTPAGLDDHFTSPSTAELAVNTRML